MYASHEGQEKITELLLRYGANPDKQSAVSIDTVIINNR